MFKFRKISNETFSRPTTPWLSTDLKIWKLNLCPALLEVVAKTLGVVNFGEKTLRPNLERLPIFNIFKYQISLAYIYIKIRHESLSMPWIFH